jgi:hypothetical protein
MGNRSTAVAVLWALLALPLYAVAQDRLVRFDGGIGVIPTSAGGVANTVRGAPPGGQPWVISRLTADVRTDGRISVDGRGLLLAGGNNIGTNAGASVFARLFCGPIATAASFDSQAVPLSPEGDFRIDGQLPGLLLQTCERPVLLIINQANGAWFAAGIPRQ